MKYYSLKNILARGCQYNLIIGERSNGKTYAALYKAVFDYIKTGKQFALVRRWRDDFIGKRGESMFEALNNNGVVESLTNGQWTGIYYYASKWYLYIIDEITGKRILSDTPVGYGFSLSSTEHDKSTSYPNVTNIIFDEFISRTGYIKDEFILFMNTISTIVRHRTDVTIIMLGNTVNKYCPYFNEMGLTHIKDMKQGTIDVYNYGDSVLRVAVEYCKPNKTGKPSDIYFAFNNPKLSMITSGVWEIAIYPHCPIKYTPKDILFTFYICFDGDTLECHIIGIKSDVFIFIHPRTREIRNKEKQLIYTTEYDINNRHMRKITKPFSKIEQKIATLFKMDKVFYSDNSVGEIVRNYLIWCGK